MLTAPDSTLLSEAVSPLTRLPSFDCKSLDIELALESREGFNMGAQFDYSVLDDLVLLLRDLAAALNYIKRLLKLPGNLSYNPLLETTSRPTSMHGLRVFASMRRRGTPSSRARG